MNAADWPALVDRSAGPEGCWPWQGTIHPDGYAIAYFRGVGQVKVHRVALAATGIDLTPGRFVLHTCDNRRCVNAAHLYEGTAADNGRDMAVRGRSRNAYTKHRGIPA